MLHKAKGVVLHSVKYSETSVIVKIYTDILGLKSFIIRGIRSKKSKIKPGLFQPLSLLDLVFYYRENASLHTIKELHISCPYMYLPFDIKKSSVALFINEILHKTIREEEANPDLFEYLWNTCTTLDHYEGNVACFHLSFLVHYMHFLGIQPQDNYSEVHPFFNIREGFFQSDDSGQPHCFDYETGAALHTLFSVAPGELKSLNIPPLVRARLLSGILVLHSVLA
jgi:DNA repair protein RecO (recombination protein O)